MGILIALITGFPWLKCCWSYCLKRLFPTKLIRLKPADDHHPFTGEANSPFARLPDEIVGKIFGKLCTGDRVRTRLICRSWKERLTRADFPVEPEPPWIIQSNDSYAEPKYFVTEMSFRSKFEARTYTFTLPKSGWRWRWWCCGSPGKGWLLMSGCVGSNLKTTAMVLWDPLSGTTVKLPPLSTLPFFGGLMESCVKHGLKSLTIHTIGSQVVSVGDHHVAVAVLFGDEDDEVLVVTTIHDLSSFVYGDEVFACSQTGGFEVRRLKIGSEKGLCNLEKMDRIGEQGIFVGTSGSTAVDRVEAECIHFAMRSNGWAEDKDDENQVVSSELKGRYFIREHGVFDVPQCKINRISATSANVQSGFCTGWFTPKLTR